MLRTRRTSTPTPPLCHTTRPAPHYPPTPTLFPHWAGPHTAYLHCTLPGLGSWNPCVALMDGRARVSWLRLLPDAHAPHHTRATLPADYYPVPYLHPRRLTCVGVRTSACSASPGYIPYRTTRTYQNFFVARLLLPPAVRMNCCCTYASSVVSFLDGIRRPFLASMQDNARAAMRLCRNRNAFFIPTRDMGERRAAGRTDGLCLFAPL